MARAKKLEWTGQVWHSKENGSVENVDHRAESLSDR